MLDIIIPVYNSHEYVKDCLNSLSKQTIIDKALITIIDDGSKKKYDYLISSFPNLNIQIIRHKKNKGPGKSRQIGITKTFNDYIMFMDSDDTLIGNKALEKLYNKITSDNKVKAVMGREYKNGKSYYNESHAVAKIFKREIINKYKIKFPSLKMEEDVGFSLCYLSMLEKNEFVKVSEVIYMYRSINSNSITKRYKNYDYKEFLKAIDYAYKYVLKYKKYNYFKIRIYYIYLSLAETYFVKIIRNNEVRESYLINVKKFIKKYNIYLDNIPKIGITKYNDKEYDLACKFWNLIDE